MPTSALAVHLKALPREKGIQFITTLRNESPRPLIVLREEPVVAAGTRGVTEISVVETETPPLMFYYAYTPEFETLEPGTSHTHRFSLSARRPGKRRFRITYGYLDAPFVPVSADPRGDFTRMQTLAHSNVVEVTVR